MKNFGYVYIASVSEAYYKAAVYSAQSLKDFYPKAKITLFTHERFVQDKDRIFFDNIVTNIPIHIRAKMYGMARTPYDRTLYMDADTEIRSKRIKEVFDFLDNRDIMFTKIVPHVSADKVIDKDNKLEYHGGIILYNNKPLTINLVNDWYEQFLEQTTIADWSSSRFKDFNPRMQGWDQFTIWHLLFKNQKYKEVKHGFFPNGGHEFNYIYLLEYESIGEKNAPYRDLEQVIYHYTIPKEKVDAGNIKVTSGSVIYFN